MAEMEKNIVAKKKGKFNDPVVFAGYIVIGLALLTIIAPLLLRIIMALSENIKDNVMLGKYGGFINQLGFSNDLLLILLQAVLGGIILGIALIKYKEIKNSLASNEHIKTVGNIIMLVGALLFVNTLLMSITGKNMPFFPMWQAPIGLVLVGLYVSKADKKYKALAENSVFAIIGHVLMLIGAFFILNFVATLLTGGRYIFLFSRFITLQIAIGLLVVGIILKNITKMAQTAKEKGIVIQIIAWILLTAVVFLSINWLAMILLGKPTGVPSYPTLQLLVAGLLLGILLNNGKKLFCAVKNNGPRWLLAWIFLIVGIFFGVEMLLKGVLHIFTIEKKKTFEIANVLIHNYLRYAVLYAGIGASLFVLLRKLPGWHERTFTDTGYKLTQIGKAIHSVALVAFPFALVFVVVTLLLSGWQLAVKYLIIAIVALLAAWVMGIGLNSLGIISMRSEKEAALDVVVSWQCEECGENNPISIVKCKNCGHIK